MDKLTRAFADYYQERIADGVTKHCAEFDASGDVLTEAVGNCLAKRLHPLVARVFVVDFHERRAEWGLPVDENSSTAIDRYLDELGSSTITRWFDEYPVLADLVHTVVGDSIDHVLEIDHRWRTDRGQLIDRGFVPADAEIVGIEQMASDPHQHGRMVAAIRFTDGSRVFYKPRSLGAEEFARASMQLISRTAGIDVGMCAPDSMDRGAYGWQREVIARGADGADDIQRYYERLGVVCALLNAVGATDLHHENIVAVGDHPVMLDLETVLHPVEALTSQELSGALINRLERSLAATLLLPQRMPKGPYSVLLSGIGVAYEQQSSRTEFIMVNRDTDALDIAKRTATFAHTDNLLADPAGMPTDVLDYRGTFLDGLRRGTEAVVEHAEELIASLDDRPFDVRQIYRSTSVYGRLLDAATHPDNLRRQEDFDRIITMLRPPPKCRRMFVQNFIADAERRALARGDVPYFVAPSDDIRTRSEDLESPPATDLSPRDRAAYGLRRTGPQALQFEELLVEEGLAELRHSRREHEPGYRPSIDDSWGDSFLGADGVDAVAVLQRLLDVSVDVEGVDGTERGWICGAFGPNLATFDPGSSIAFHDAGGILVPFERMATLRGDAAMYEHAREIRRGVRTLARVNRGRLDSVPLSIASGSLSIAYLLGHRETALPLDDWGDGRLVDPERCPPGDPMTGLPGAALLLAGFPGTPVDHLQELERRLPQATDRDWELAHGGLGLAWARHRLASALGDKPTAARIAASFHAAVSGAPQQLPSAWCAGNAGICLVASELAADEGVVRRHAELAATLPSPETPIDLSVCHGAAGVVQVLVHVAQSRGLAWALDIAADYWQRVVKHARDCGYVTGDPARQGVLGYFLGWSGIADTELMLAAALEGESVWVPLSFMTSSEASRDDAA